MRIIANDINWQDTYPGLPDLPEAKLWEDVGGPNAATKEQIITYKLINRQPISSKENNLLIDCISYYKRLKISLQKLNVSKFSEEELNNFFLYIGYAYNFLVLLSNQVELYQTYRIVENIDGNSKTNASQLSYPPLEIVKERNVFNRASSPKSTVFYCSESIDSVFKELRPSVGCIITLGVWEPRTDNKFLAYPIMASPHAQIINSNSNATSQAYKSLKKRNNPLLGHFWDGYFNVLNQEYSKRIKDKREYFISSFFSEKIFETRESEWNYDCIIYPSIGNEFSHSNFAFKPDVVDSRLKLVKAAEIEILETYYDRKANISNSGILTVARVRNIRMSKEIAENGDIVWNS